MFKSKKYINTTNIKYNIYLYLYLSSFKAVHFVRTKQA